MTLLLSTTSIISLRDENTEGQRGEVIFSRSHSGEGVEAGAESWLTLWGAFQRWEGWCAGLKTGGRSTVALALLCDPDSEHPAGSLGNEGELKERQSGALRDGLGGEARAGGAGP